MNSRCLTNNTSRDRARILPKKSTLLLLILFIGVFTGLVYAGVTARISGTVTDASGAAVVGATVTATNVDTGVAATQTTNGQGYYSFQDLSVGKYTIEVQQKGFKTTRRSDIILEV